MVTDNVEKAEEEAASLGYNLDIEFDNDTDPNATVITVSGKDHTDLLSQMTGAFNSLDMVVISATISTDSNGHVLDVFRVTEEDAKVRLLLSFCRFKAAKKDTTDAMIV